MMEIMIWGRSSGVGPLGSAGLLSPPPPHLRVAFTSAKHQQ